MIAVALVGVLVSWRARARSEPTALVDPAGADSVVVLLSAASHFAAGVEPAAQAAISAVSVALAGGVGGADGHLLCRLQSGSRDAGDGVGGRGRRARVVLSGSHRR